MSQHDEHDESFEETMRSIARELGRSVERAMERVDFDDIAETIGVDPASAREWADSIGGWLRTQAEHLGEEMAQRGSGWSAPAPDRPAPGPPGSQRPGPERPGPERPAQPGPRPTSPADDPLRSAAPHPLDLPTDEQGLALTALESRRWTVEPETNRLAAHGDGPGPNDALGLVRELRVHDWITADGRLTLAGHHALRRWLDAAGTRG